VTEGVGGDESLQPLADIWATVELERALRERGRNPDEAAAAVTDPHLGARLVVIAHDDGRDEGVATGPALALAEPTTEGRLAASLARNGEGPAGRYVALPDGDTLDAYRRRAHAAGIAISRVEPGPFGRSVLLLGQPVAGPHLIVVERRSIPSRP
jgi:hypothetical protein